MITSNLLDIVLQLNYNQLKSTKTNYKLPIVELQNYKA